jgi:NAD(P)-dependent dehydrogenase (short-subunit alcohol dehydrogenase family)
MTVYITGGARRIGRHLAQAFLQDGHDVGIIYRTSQDSADSLVAHARSIGRTAFAIAADVADEHQLTDACGALKFALGAPDLIISNAGIFPEPVAIEDLQTQHVRDTLDVNTLPLIAIASWYLKHKGPDVGRLVAIGSLGGQEIWKDRLAYNVSKSALDTVVRSLARSCAPQIAVNCVAPGAISVPDEASSNDQYLVADSRIPMGRLGVPEDILSVVRFLATCSTYITGQVISVDGGYGLVR